MTLSALHVTSRLTQRSKQLEYNYRVLVERDHENAGTLQIQRRKIAKTREKLMKAKDLFAAMDKKFSDENMRLTDDHRRVTEQFKELEIKFRTFQANDRKKFKAVDLAGRSSPIRTSPLRVVRPGSVIATSPSMNNDYLRYLRNK